MLRRSMEGRPRLLPLGRCISPPREGYDEAWLAEIWARQAFDRRELRTTTGLDFQVVYPGLRLGGAGPDFRDAILALPDGRLLRGDVEIHLHSQGWEQHGHGRDPAYDQVLLHVVLIAGGCTYNSQGEAVLTLELGERLQRRRAGEPNHLAASTAQLTYMVAPCKQRLPALEPPEVEALLGGLARERFQAKQAVFEGELAVFEPDQVLYGALLEALGYSRNRAPFRRLAQLAPLEAVRSARTPQAIEGLLLDAAGLTPFASGGPGRDGLRNSAPAVSLPRAPTSSPEKESGGSGAAGGALETAELPGMRLAPEAWQTAGVRPDNWPMRRIGQGAAVLARLTSELVDGLLGGLREMPEADLRSARASPSARTLRATWQQQLRELGPQRADAVAINVLLPFAAAYGQATCQFGLAERAVGAFLAYPAEGGNQVTRHLRREVLGPLAPRAAGAAGEQALLHVWDSWCHDKVCALCPLGGKGRR